MPVHAVLRPSRTSRGSSRSDPGCWPTGRPTSAYVESSPIVHRATRRSTWSSRWTRASTDIAVESGRSPGVKPSTGRPSFARRSTAREGHHGRRALRWPVGARRGSAEADATTPRRAKSRWTRLARSWRRGAGERVRGVVGAARPPARPQQAARAADSKGRREVRQKGLIVISLNQARQRADRRPISLVSDPVQAGVMAVMATCGHGNIRHRQGTRRGGM